VAQRIVILTGGIGSGKSAAARLFADLGVTIVDADAISHQLTGPDGAALKAIETRFGPSALATITSPQGQPTTTLNRSAMRDRIFQDPAARQQLEAILHPMIREIAKKELAQAPGNYAIYMLPLWVERQSSRGLEADQVVVVDCDAQTQIRWVMQRNHFTEPQVRAMLAAQAKREDRLDVADHVIDNNGSLEDLQAQVKTLHQKLNQP
jgi:dephospho-CoA kinase